MQILRKKYIVFPPYRVVANKPRLLRNMFSVLNLPMFPENEQRRKHLVVRNLLPALISNPGHWVRSHNQMELKMLIVDFQKLCCINRKIKLDVNSKRQIQVENFSKQSMRNNEQWTTSKGETWSRGANSRLPFDLNMMLNLSNTPWWWLQRVVN